MKNLSEKIIRSYAFNQEEHIKRNRHIFHLTRANIGVVLKDSFHVTGKMRLDILAKLDSLLDNEDIAHDSFKALLFQRLEEIKDNLRTEIDKANEITKMVDGLIKFFTSLKKKTVKVE